MAEIEITLPTVQYGNIKITATPEEWGLETIADAPDVGVWAATYLNLFTQGYKQGAKLDVDAHLTAPEPVSEEQAQRYLDEGLGGVSEVEENQYDRKHEVLSEGVSDAPWDKPQPAASKPWEKGSEAPAEKPVVDEGW